MLSATSELWVDRWCWARDAVQSVRAQLDPRLGQLIGGGDGEVSVVLYGPTQVGKSTLVLTLLGVARQHRVEVAHALGSRGGGRSVTVAPLRYRWAGDAWEIIADGRTSTCTGDQLRERILGLRDELGGTGPRRDPDPITIGLPERFRGTPTAHVPHVLDLPGYNDADPRVRAAVPAMVQRHVPPADLVILVASAEHMRPLADAVYRPELDWPALPHRFRVVLTRSITVAYGNNPAFRGRTDPITPAELRATAAAELARSPETTAAGDLAHLLYPVELGDSWDKANDRERALFGSANAELLDELAKQVDLVAADDRRYVALPEAAHAVSRHYDRRRGEILGRIDAECTTRKAVADRGDRLTAERAATADQLASAQKRHQLAAACRADVAAVAVALPMPVAPLEGRHCQLDEQRVTVRAAVRAATAEWRVRDCTARLAEVAGLRLPTILVPESVVDPPLEQAHLGDATPCWDGQPWGLMPRCHERLGEQWAGLRDALAEQLRAPIRRWLDEVDRRLPALDPLYDRLAALDELRTDVQAELKAAEQVLGLMEAELTACDEEAARSERVAGRIIAEVDRHWQRHVQGLTCRFAAATDRGDREELFFAYLLAHHLRDKIADGRSATG